MGAFDAVEKLINEHGSAAIRSEIIGLLREQAQIESKKLLEVTSERDALLEEKKTLLEKVTMFEARDKYEPYRGVLWRKDAKGEIEPEPYCPKCKMVMHEIPPSDFSAPQYWSCTPCQVKAKYCDPPTE